MSPGLALLSRNVRVGGSAGMACSGAPILGGGREGGSLLPRPRRSGAPHPSWCFGNLPPSLARTCWNFSLSGTAAPPFFPKPAPTLSFLQPGFPSSRAQVQAKLRTDLRIRSGR